MNRLCERPGCSEPASVAYGMRPEDLVFWLDVLIGDDAGRRVLCRRHADTMIVPRGWTLDDLRDPDLHLFRPPPLVEPPASRAGRRVRSVADDAGGEQLRLGDVPPAPAEAPGDHVPTVGAADGADGANGISGISGISGVNGADGEAAEASEPWTPTFDDADDLDGLLSARSPLLARAFRGADRPRST